MERIEVTHEGPELPCARCRKRIRLRTDRFERRPLEFPREGIVCGDCADVLDAIAERSGA